MGVAAPEFAAEKAVTLDLSHSRTRVCVSGDDAAAFLNRHFSAGPARGFLPGGRRGLFGDPSRRRHPVALARWIRTLHAARFRAFTVARPGRVGATVRRRARLIAGRDLANDFSRGNESGLTALRSIIFVP